MPLLGSLAAGSVKGFGAQANLGYFLGQSLRFRRSASAYLTRTPTTAGNRRTFTYSGWIKRGLSGNNNFFSVNQNSSYGLFSLQFDLNSGGDLGVYQNTAGTGTILNVSTNSRLRDHSAWYHIVVAVDTTQATASNRVKIYVNGILQSVTIATQVAQNTELHVNNTLAHNIGKEQTASGGSNNYFDGYMGDVYFVDGQALTPSDFGKTDPSTGSWIPKKYSGTYGTNGFKLDFKHQSSASGFNTVLYTGTGAAQTIDNVGFSPDLVWFKRRTTDDHDLQDSVRGIGKSLLSNSANAEQNNAGSYGISSFNANGFSLVGNGGRTNSSGGSYTAWCWDAGSSTVSNTDGTITSSVRANPATGFSVVTYTGTGVSSATVGHGLGVAPKMIILKNRDGAYSWPVMHSSLPTNGNVFLESTQAYQTTYSTGGIANPANSTTFGFTTTSTLEQVNGNTNNYVAYCFAEIAGFSKFGSYTGNGSTTGPTVTTGFRPAFVMIKRTDTTGDWAIWDNTRDPSNPNNANLFPHETTAETINSQYDIDFLDTGFQLKNTNASRNASGGTYIYMAFADTRDTAFWRDKSGTDNHWSLNAINYAASAETTYDLMNDVPTLTSEDKSNFAVLNPIGVNGSYISDGNLKYSTNLNLSSIRASFEMPSTGKFYIEITPAAVPNYIGYGFATNTSNGGLNAGTPSADGVANCYPTSSIFYGVNNTSVGSVSQITLGGIYTLAYDCDTKKIWFGYANSGASSVTWYNSGNPSAGTGETGTISSTLPLYFFMSSNDIVTQTSTVNFGQRPFKYTPPTGYKTLNTYNL